MQSTSYIGSQLLSPTLHLPSSQSMPTGSQTLSLIDPANNDAPLEFNTNRGKGLEKLDPQDLIGLPSKDDERWLQDKDQDRMCDRERSRDRIRDIREKRMRERERERNGREKERENKGLPTSSQALSSVNALSESNLLPGVAGHIPMVSHSGVLPGLSTSQWTLNQVNPFAMMGVAGEPNFLGVMGMTGFSQFGFMGCSDPGPVGGGSFIPRPVREVIRLPSCVLYPPKPNAPIPTTRERPPGCRTVFVGGLPESITDSIIKEVFVRCGEIATIRMSKKNFCHIRYENEMYIDNAIALSGYRIKIEDKDDAAYTGRLHVDYAQARDDQYEWECNQRAFQRELRHRERLEQERLRPPSPPPVVHYSDHEASLLIEKLRGEETFQKAVQILITWLERGECNKRNVGHFYSMIQSTNSHVRRLMSEKAEYEDELIKAKQLLQQRMQGIFIQFNQIEKVFVAANHQKVWDHFTKAQRKNIDMWQKQTEEVKNAQLEEVLNEREEYEMEVSDGEDGETQPSRKSKLDDDEIGISNHDKNQEPHLHDENDSLRCQLEAYRNEVEVLRAENTQEQEARERQIKLLQQALQGMQQQLISVSQQHIDDEEEIRKLHSLLDSNERNKESSNDKNNEADQPDKESSCIQQSLSSDSSTSSDAVYVTQKEAQLIGLISAFLHLHPFGAGLDYIWSYLHQIEDSLRPRDVEGLMLKFPSVFKQELSGVGALLERKWTFAGFNMVNQST